MKYKVLLKGISRRMADSQEFDSFDDAITFASEKDKDNQWRISVIAKDENDASIYTSSGEEIVSFRNVR